jgi:hypothetical protein
MPGMMYDHPRRFDAANDPPPEPALTPAQRTLLLAAGPSFLDSDELNPPTTELAAAVEPDDWRIYYLMRELPEPDRAQILAFTELLYNLRHAQRWAADRQP